MRRTPYTTAGIKRCKCVRCGGVGYSQWQVCADGRTFRVLCAECDIVLNELVLHWVMDPDSAAKMQRYRAKVAAALAP